MGIKFKVFHKLLHDPGPVWYTRPLLKEFYHSKKSSCKSDQFEKREKKKTGFSANQIFLPLLLTLEGIRSGLERKLLNRRVHFLEISLFAMEIWVSMEAGLPYGQRLEGGQALSFVRLSPVFFFISLTSIGCGPSRWSMAKRIWEENKSAR